LVFLVAYFLLAFPPIIYKLSSSPPFVLHGPPISSSATWLFCTWRRVQIMKLLVMQFSPFNRHLIPLRSKYSPQYPVLKHHQILVLHIPILLEWKLRIFKHD
jgi:hypothetical protein